MVRLPCIEFDHPDRYDDSGVAMVLGSTPAFEASPVSMAPSGRRYLYSCGSGGTLWKCVSEPKWVKERMAYTAEKIKIVSGSAKILNLRRSPIFWQVESDVQSAAVLEAA